VQAAFRQQPQATSLAQPNAKKMHGNLYETIAVGLILISWKRFTGQKTVELSYHAMKGTEYFVSLQTCVVVTEKHNVLVDSEE
jgi:hypothetical protein